MKDRDEVAAEFAAQFSSFVNGSSSLSEKVAEAMARDHPTLQQGYMRFFMLFCEKMAAQKWTDLRNEASVKLAKSILPLNKGLPLI